MLPSKMSSETLGRETDSLTNDTPCGATGAARG